MDKREAERFAQESAVVILLAFTFIELLSSLQLSRGLTSDLPHPFNIVISSLIVVFSLLGVYGLVASKSVGIFFASLAALWEIVIGMFSLGDLFQDGSHLGAIVQILAAIILGAASLCCVSKFYQPLLKKGHGQLIVSNNAQNISTERYAVEVVDLVKKYLIGPVVVPAINGLNLKVKKGEFISIMGPSGCGKSTLLNLIGALDRPSSGKVMIDGVDISTLDKNALAHLRNEKIGFIFQAYNLINRSTVFRNVELPTLVRHLSKEERERKVKNMLKIVGLLDKADRKPRLLSGGEQQRVAIARALVNEPSIILADEPTGNLDSKTGRDVINFMRELNRKMGTTIIVVTHSLEVSEATDRIVYLRDGRIVKEEIKRRDLR